MNYLITGGCGFIGSSLIKKMLTELSFKKILVLDNLTVGTQEDLAEVCNFQITEDIRKSSQGVYLQIGDIRNYDSCRQAVHGMDCIIHLAANTGVGPSVVNPRFDLETNITGTFNMLEAARSEGMKKFIFASSGAPIGEATPPINEEMAPHPVSPYGASKLAGEGYCSAYANTYGIDTIALRFGNVYGPRSKYKSSIVAKFIKQAIAGETCEIFGDGTQTRDFIYIDDLTNAIMMAERFEGKGEIFQIATGKERTVLEVAKILQNELNNYDVNMIIQHSKPRLGDVQSNYSDITKAKIKLDWEPYMEIITGIKKTVSSYFQ